jgi:hypothetical protein
MPKTAGLSAGHKAAKRRIFGQLKSAGWTCRRHSMQCAPVKKFYNKALFCRPERCLSGAGCGQLRRRRKQAAAAQAVCAIIAGYLSQIFCLRVFHVEINPYLNQLKDLSGRGQTLRGYL